MATHVSALWRTRCRFDHVAAAGLCVALLAGPGCGDAASDGQKNDGPLPDAVAPAVVEFVAARDGLSDAKASAKAEDTLRLARAYLEDHDGEPPPPARRAHLERSSLARLWLKTDFEARNGPDQIPADAVAETLDDPRILHPRIHKVCQVILTPPPGDDGAPATAPDDADWRERARTHAERYARHLRRYVPHPGDEMNCLHTFQTIEFDAQPEDDDMIAKRETGVYEVCRDDLWDAGFVEALCPEDAPGVYGPFFTRYGAHVVVVIDVEPDNRPEGDAARKAMVREALVPSWRQAQYPIYMDRLRARFDVRRIDRSSSAPVAPP